MSAADVLLSRLEGVRQTGHGRWIARCPAHADRSPSLSIRELDDGRVLLHDFAGCHVGQVLGAAGLEFDALFPPRQDDRRRGPRETRPFPAADALRALDDDVLYVWAVSVSLTQSDDIAAGSRSELAAIAGRVRATRLACGLGRL